MKTKKKRGNEYMKKEWWKKRRIEDWRYQKKNHSPIKFQRVLSTTVLTKLFVKMPLPLFLSCLLEQITANILNTTANSMSATSEIFTLYYFSNKVFKLETNFPRKFECFNKMKQRQI
jgi:hypothetical protein